MGFFKSLIPIPVESMATQAEVAETLGLTDRWLRKLVEDGVLTDLGRGKWDTITTARQLLDYRGREIERLKAQVASLQSQAARGSESGAKGFEEARRMKALADLAELKAGEMSGALIPADQVAGKLHEAVTMMKTGLLSIPAKAAARVGAKDVARAEQVIKDEVVEALNALSRIEVKGPATAQDA